MKKRVLSLVIAVCMLVSLLPVVGVAADATPDYSIRIKDYAADNSISSLNNSISKEQTADYGAWSFTGARSAGVSYSGKIYMGNGYYGVNVTINEPGLYRAEMIYDTTTTSADAAVYIAPYGTNNATDDQYKIVDIPWADADALGIVAESAEDFQLAEGEYTIYFKANASWCRTANVNPETGRTEDYHVAPGEPIPAKKPDYVDGVLTNAEGWTLGGRDRYFCMDKLNLYKVGEVPAESVVIENAPTGILEVGATAELTAAILPAAAAYQSAEWSTSDASVVTVENGVIEAVGIGFATVTATVGDLTDSVVITVAEKANDWQIEAYYDSLTTAFDNNAGVTAEDTKDFGGWAYTGSRNAGFHYNGQTYLSGNGKYFSIDVSIAKTGLYRAQMTYDAWPSSADGEVFITKKKTTDQIDLVSIPWATAKADDLSVLGDEVLLTAGDYTVTFVCNASHSGGSYVNPETGETGSGNYDRYLVIDSLQLYMLGELATVDGAAVRVEDPMGIRFYSSIPKTLAEDVVEYGTMLIPTAMLGDEELSSETESVAIVPAEKLYKATDSAYQFTAVLYNIPYSAYKTEITARAYAKLSDGSYIYGNTTARSIYRVAELGLENPNASAVEKATFEAIIANAQ